MMSSKRLGILILISIIIIVVAVPMNVRADQVGPTITAESPANNSTISTHTPVIIAQYYSTAGIRTASVTIVVDGLDVTGLGSRTVITDQNVTYSVMDDLPLKDGYHNVTVKVTDNSGATTTLTWGFTIDTSQKSEIIQQIMFYIVIGVGLGLAIFGALLYVLKRTKNFSLRKYLKKNPIPKKLFYVLVPSISAFFFVLFALSYFEGSSGAPPFISEIVMVVGIFILLLPYAIYVQLEKKKRMEYERAFSQFLYEMADAMRGGIDPSKAVIELSKTDTTILGKHLKIAANGLEMGRPFEEIIEAMVKPIESKLIKRYASLIGESAKIGGEISRVVHRAAKDMDDLIKIDQDRTRNLAIQGSTIYISFGVLLVVIYLLINIYPSLGQADFGNMFSRGSGLTSAADASAAAGKMSYVTLKQRFLDLTMVTGLGSGLIIGVFTNGKAKYGLVHGLVMMLAGAVFLMIMMG